jgi:6-phosphogluconolactonase (cycloisomerase 2 family)
MDTRLLFPGRARAGLLALGAIFALLLALPAASATAARGPASMVYTMTNSPTGNQVLAFERSQDGSLDPAGVYDTGGNGDGQNLGSQGSVVLSDDGRYLAVANAGSGSVTVFRVKPSGLEIFDIAEEALFHPVSVDIHRNLLVALSANGPLVAYRIEHDGLEFVPESYEPVGGQAAQVSFSPDGRHLAVTVKDLNGIVAYDIDRDGDITITDVAPSASPIPFGFAFDRFGRAIVSEAFQSALSVYDIDRDGMVSLVAGPVPDGQVAACWVVLSKDGRYAYTANAGSASISSYRLARDGSITLVNSVAAQTATQPLDMAISGDGRFLYAISRIDGVINVFAIGRDGSLTPVEAEPGIPATSFGLAAS